MTPQLEITILSIGAAIAAFIVLINMIKCLFNNCLETDNKEDFEVWEQADKIMRSFRKVNTNYDAEKVRERIHAFRNVQDGNTSRQGYAYRLELMLNNKMLKVK